jgi:hypothetical protein
MLYTEQQQEANLVFFLHDFLQPAVQATRSADALSSSRLSYSSFALLEAFLWLHIGVGLQYMLPGTARRVVYEYGNRILAAYERVKLDKRLGKFSPPLQTLMDVEFSGRVVLFGGAASALLPPSDELSLTYQTALILAAGFVSDADVTQLLKMVIFAPPRVWNAALGKDASLDLDSNQQLELDTLPKNWMFAGFVKTVQFMESSRHVRRDFEEVKPSSDGLIALRGLLREIQNWRLSFGEEDVRDRFLQIARNAIQVIPSELLKDEALQKVRDKSASLVQIIYDLMTDWGAPPMSLTQGAI